MRTIFLLVVPLTNTTGVSAVVFVLGYAWFYRLRRSFADLL